MSNPLGSVAPIAANAVDVIEIMTAQPEPLLAYSRYATESQLEFRFAPCRLSSSVLLGLSQAVKSGRYRAAAQSAEADLRSFRASSLRSFSQPVREGSVWGILSGWMK